MFSAGSTVAVRRNRRRPRLTLCFPFRAAADAQPVHDYLGDKRRADVFVGLARLAGRSRGQVCRVNHASSQFSATTSGDLSVAQIWPQIVHRQYCDTPVVNVLVTHPSRPQRSHLTHASMGLLDIERTIVPLNSSNRNAEEHIGMFLCLAPERLNYTCERPASKPSGCSPERDVGLSLRRCDG